MDSHEKRRVVEQFYDAMNTNDFRAAGDWLHAEYVLEWPQSGERVRGRDNFIAINQNYPAAGPWRFTIQHLMADESGVASDVVVSDGAVTARAIAFSDIRDGKIYHQTEYWPDPFDAVPARAQWVERMDAGG
jgi:ketosteroid isomerase-like protein